MDIVDSNIKDVPMQDGRSAMSLILRSQSICQTPDPDSQMFKYVSCASLDLLRTALPLDSPILCSRVADITVWEHWARVQALHFQRALRGRDKP